MHEDLQVPERLAEELSRGWTTVNGVARIELALCFIVNHSERYHHD